MDEIIELRKELESLGPQWNLTGKIDRMKKMLDNIERDITVIKFETV